MGETKKFLQYLLETREELYIGYYFGTSDSVFLCHFVFNAIRIRHISHSSEYETFYLRSVLV